MWFFRSILHSAIWDLWKSFPNFPCFVTYLSKNQTTDIKTLLLQNNPNNDTILDKKNNNIRIAAKYLDFSFCDVTPFLVTERGHRSSLRIVVSLFNGISCQYYATSLE